MQKMNSIGAGMWSYKRSILAILAIIIIGFVIYANTLSNGFTYDDELVVTKNPFITSLANIRYFFTPAYFAGSGEFSYRPILTLTYLLDYHFWKFNPVGYHLTNIILHILNGILAYFFIGLLAPRLDPKLKAYPIAIISAILFIIHPIQTEAVNSPAFRDDSVFGIFFFAFLIFYLKAKAGIPSRKPLFYAASFLCCFLSFFAKELALLSVFIVLLIDICECRAVGSPAEPGSRPAKRALVYSGYMLATGAFLYIALFMIQNPVAALRVKTNLNYSLYNAIVLTGTQQIIHYFKLLIFPFNLSVEYTVPRSVSIMQSSVFFSVSTLIVFAVFMIIRFRKNRILAFSFLWILMFVAPSILFPFRAIAEHYLYISCAGFCLLLAAFMVKGLSFKKYSNIVLAAMALLSLLYGWQAVARNAIWKDPITFWEARLKYSPGTARAYSSMGDAYLADKRYADAENAYRNAMAIDDKYADAHNNIGNLYAKKGSPDEAINEFKKAVELKPDFMIARYNLANAYRDKGLYDKAIAEYGAVIKELPFHALSYNNLGSVYRRQGSMDKAMENFKKAAELDPGLLEAHYNMGLMYRGNGVNNKAKDEWETVLKLKPGHPQALKQLEELEKVTE